MTPTCTYDSERGWLSPEHRSDCKGRECAGCRPCAKSHCAMRGRCPNHVEHGAGIVTCPGCIGRTRKQVRKILDRYAELPAEAAVAGVDSEAMNLHGPAADPAQVQARRRWDVTRGWCDFPRTIADDDPHHPYLVLGRWDLALRETYGPSTDLLVSVSRAVDYLTGPLLDTFAHNDEFEEFARDIAECLNHLEDVLRDSREPEKGAPCPTCRSTIEADESAPKLLKRYGSTEEADTWHCPRNGEHWWTDRDYRDRIDREYVKHATTLTADQAAERFSIKASAIRVWGSRGLVRKAGKNQAGITLYVVEDIEGRHAHDDNACA